MRCKAWWAELWLAVNHRKLYKTACSSPTSDYSPDSVIILLIFGTLYMSLPFRILYN